MLCHSATSPPEWHVTACNYFICDSFSSLLFLGVETVRILLYSLSFFWISVHMLPGRAIREHRKSREEEERKAGRKKGPLGLRGHGYQNRCQGTLPRLPF